jgi:hypothetical protein
MEVRGELHDWQLYPRGTEPLVWEGWVDSKSRFRRRFLSMLGIEPIFFGRSTRNLDSVQTELSQYTGRAIAQAVSRWLRAAAARVRARFWSCGICGGQSGAGAGFLRVLRFPLPIFIPPISPQSPSSITWGLYNRPVVAAVPSGLSHSTNNIKKNPSTQPVSELTRKG